MVRFEKATSQLQEEAEIYCLTWYYWEVKLLNEDIVELSSEHVAPGMGKPDEISMHQRIMAALIPEGEDEIRGDITKLDGKYEEQAQNFYLDELSRTGRDDQKGAEVILWGSLHERGHINDLFRLITLRQGASQPEGVDTDIPVSKPIEAEAAQSNPF